MITAELAEYLIDRKTLVDAALAERLPSEEVEPRHVHAAMRYAVLSGGKRLRSVLALAIAEIGGAICPLRTGNLTRRRQSSRRLR